MGGAAPCPQTIRLETISERQHACSFSYSFLTAEFCDSRQRNFMLLGQCYNFFTVTTTMMIMTMMIINCVYLRDSSTAQSQL
jgi:hypothetical protein